MRFINPFLMFGMLGWVGVLVGLLPHLLIAIYIYKDAKIKDAENPLLWAIVAFIIPYYIGAILYLVIYRNKKMIKCPTCNNETDARKAFCANCGADLSLIEKEERMSAPKGYLIAAIVLIAAEFIGIMFFFLNINRPMMHHAMMYDNYYDNNQVAQDDVKYLNKENANYEFKNESDKHVMKFNVNNNKENLTIDYNIKKGKTVLEFYKNAQLIEGVDLKGKGNIVYNYSELANFVSKESEGDVLNIIIRTDNATGKVTAEIGEAESV